MDHCESPKILRGRRSEQQALERLVADTQTGMGGALVLRGEPGIGKTSLLDYLATCGTGCRILRVAGVDSETELDFAVLHRLCGTVLDLADQLPAPQRDALAMRSAFGPRESRPLPRRSSRPCHPQGGLGRAAASLHRRRGRRCRSRLDRNARVRRAPAVGRPDRNRLCRPQREVKRAGGATGAGDPGRSRRRRASARRVDRRRSTSTPPCAIGSSPRRTGTRLPCLSSYAEPRTNSPVDSGSRTPPSCPPPRPRTAGAAWRSSRPRRGRCSCSEPPSPPVTLFSSGGPRRSSSSGGTRKRQRLPRGCSTVGQRVLFRTLSTEPRSTGARRRRIEGQFTPPSPARRPTRPMPFGEPGTVRMRQSGSTRASPRPRAGCGERAVPRWLRGGRRRSSSAPPLSRPTRPLAPAGRSRARAPASAQETR